MNKDLIRNRKRIFLKKRETRLEDLKPLEQKWYDQKSWIFAEWKEKWNTEVNSNGDEDKEDDSPFYRLFCYDYIYTVNAAIRNECKNFRMKWISTCLLRIIPVLLFCRLAFIYIKGTEFIRDWIEKNTELYLGIETGVVVAVFLLMISIGNWIDVKKYQETWRRHSEHRYEIEMQMFRYISDMGEYGSPDRNEKFVDAIMKTWGRNQKNFNNNMKQEMSMKDWILFAKEFLVNKK